MARRKQPRPWVVRYFHDLNASPDAFVASGHCTSELGVLRGAYIRIFLKQYKWALVYKDGLFQYSIRADGAKHGLPSAYFGTQPLGLHLRRVQ